MNISAVRDGLADAFNFTVRAYSETPDSVVTPCVIIGPPSGEYDQDFNGQVVLDIPAVLLVSRAAGDARASRVIDEYLATEGSKSLKLAVDSDPTLGAVCDEAQLLGFTDYGGTFEVGGEQYASVTLNVRVMG